MNNTSEHNTFDTLCSTWKNQLGMLSLKSSDYQTKNYKKSADDLLNHLLKETWLECEKFFKCSQKTPVDIKLLANNFCLHLMDQLISTRQELYYIRSSKPREKESFVDTHVCDRKEDAISVNDAKITIDSLSSKDTNSSSNYMINSAEYSKNNIEKKNITFGNYSDSHLVVKPEKKSRNHHPENIKKSYSFTHFYSISNHSHHEQIDTNTKEEEKEKEKIAFEQFCREAREKNIGKSVHDKNANQQYAFLSSEEGSAKIEIDSYQNMNYSDHNGSGVSIATRHQSSPNSVLNPVYTRCKTEPIHSLPFLLENKSKPQWGSSYSSFPNATSLTTLKDKSKPRRSMLRLFPKKIKPFHLFPIKKSPL